MIELATIGCHSIKGNPQKAIDYIVNLNKTELHLIESKGCNASTAALEWSQNNNAANQTSDSSIDDVGAYHFRQAFPKGSIEPEEAFEISKQWIEAATGGNHKYVLAVHTDKEHIHTHIIVNPMNEVTKKKWNLYYKREIPEFKRISDRICLEENQPVLSHSDSKGMSYYEWQMKNKGDTLKDIIKKTIDATIPLVSDYDQFKNYLTKLGYEIEDGVDLSEPLDQEDEFRYSLNEKMFIPEMETETHYFTRIPFTKDYMYLPKENTEWTYNNTTCFVKLGLKEQFEIYNKDGQYINDKTVEMIKGRFDDKTRTGRQGLRIKVPGSKKFIRCDNIGEKYKLDNVINRIFEEGRIVLDPNVEKILNGNMSEKEQIKLRKDFYETASIKTKYSQSRFYEMTKQQKFVYFKTKELQSRLDNFYQLDRISEDISNLENLKNLRISLIEYLNVINSKINEVEIEYQELINQQMEGTIDVTEFEINNFIVENIAPLRQERLDTKNQIDDLKDRIEKAQEHINRQQVNDIER